jgi:HAD superfamily hydrolase (TIGR01509 family)
VTPTIVAGVDAVILDVDGTLADSEQDGHRVAFNLAFEEFGLDHRWSVEEYGRLLETTGGQRRLHAYLKEQGMDAAERDDLVPRLHARKTELFQELVAEGKVEPRPGTPELLDRLEAEGVRLAVATTGSRRWVAPLLDRFFGLDRFEAIVAGDEAPARKPDPSAYLLALEALGLPPSAAVAVEDSRNGLLAALGADLPCVVVVNDYTRDHDLEGATLVVDDFGALDVATLRRLCPGDGGAPPPG